ncbi:jg16222 [Pararge aegeria aegeria]|uniref:Jg16222 protein n=1 Tax=Pararge aegeria aegeria TaxID=348720 RepID=A0A8S4RVR4_9NEOP|nr:jg16222 [Pararge aegeria aegeria]
MLCMATSMAYPAQNPVQLDIIDMAAISRMSPQQLELLAEGLAAEEIMRTKRSSAQALTSAVVSKASSGLQSKVGFLSQASAGAASFIASASSKTGHSADTGYSYEPHSEKVDYWGLKKSILYTLFQAVKAITGGVTILKGQLIKGGGALAATLGKVISSKGDTVSNIGKKIVSSAALSPKKPVSTAVYGPPPTHIEYGPPSAYGATAPAAYAHTGPSAPTGFAAHKYPSQLDGRGKLNGLHAGLVILTPVGDVAHSESQHATHQHQGYTALDPPPSILNTVFSAVKDVFTSAAPIHADNTAVIDQMPPPPQSFPPFKPMSWGAVNSYGEPAMADSYTDYDPRHTYSYDHASSKHSVVPAAHKHEGLTSAKIQKINANLAKVNAYLNENQRSSEDLPRFNNQYAEMLKKGVVSLLPTPVVSDNEIGVLPAELLPDPLTTTSTTTTIRTTTKTTTTPKTEKETPENIRRKKEVKFILRGNRIVQV